jgi:hypothetical protein
MTVVKRIAPWSAFKVVAVIYAIVGLVIGILYALAMLANFALPGVTQAPRGAVVGVFAVVLFPILYGIVAGVIGAASALVYNLAASWVGGLEIDIG